MSLRAAAVRGFSLIAVLKVMTAALGNIAALILPFFLLPEDFGLFGIAIFFLGFGTLLGEFGLGTELIRRKTRFDEALSVGFTLRVLLSTVLVFALVLLATPIAVLYADPRISLLLILLTLSLIIDTLSFVPRVLATRRLDFKRLAIPNTIGKATGVVATIGFAVLGMRYWSPALGLLLGLIVGAVAFFISIPWKPKLRFERPLAREMMTFGGFVSATSIANFVAHGVDNAFVGLLMGVSPLGFYLLAYTWAVAVPSNLTSIFRAVSYPVFSHLTTDSKKLRRSYVETVRLYALFVTFITAGVVVLAHPFVTAVFGSTWIPAIPPMQILAFSGLLMGIAGLSLNLLNAVGKPRAVFSASAVEAGFIVVVIPLAILWAGLVGAAFVSVAGALVLFGLAQRAVRKHLQVRWSHLYPHFVNPSVAALVAGVGVVLVQTIWPVSLLSFLVSLALFSLLYFVTMTSLTQGQFVTELRELIRLAVRRQPETPLEESPRRPDE